MDLRVENQQGSFKVPADLVPFLPGYISRRMEELEQIAAAIEANDTLAISHIGHKLKGNGTGFGFPSLTALGDELMQACTAGDIGELRKLYKRLEIEVLKIREKFKI